jgi:hypothetical protein
MWGFGHLPACNGLFQNAGGRAWEPAGHLPRAAGGQVKTQARALSNFAFRGQGAMRDKMYGLICGGMSPTRVVLNDCEGLRQEALLPSPCDLSGRAFLGSQGSGFNGLSLSHVVIVIGHTTTLVASSIL